jgi:hypothetical protein
MSAVTVIPLRGVVIALHASVRPLLVYATLCAAGQGSVDAMVWYHWQILNQEMPLRLCDHRKEALWRW